MLDAATTSQLKAYLDKVVMPVELVATVDDSAKSREIIELINELQAAAAGDALRGGAVVVALALIRLAGEALGAALADQPADQHDLDGQTAGRSLCLQAHRP